MNTKKYLKSLFTLAIANVYGMNTNTPKRKYNYLGSTDHMLQSAEKNQTKKYNYLGSTEQIQYLEERLKQSQLYIKELQDEHQKQLQELENQHQERTQEIAEEIHITASKKIQELEEKLEQEKHNTQKQIESVKSLEVNLKQEKVNSNKLQDEYGESIQEKDYIIGTLKKELEQERENLKESERKLQELPEELSLAYAKNVKIKYEEQIKKLNQEMQELKNQHKKEIEEKQVIEGLKIVKGLEDIRPELKEQNAAVIIEMTQNTQLDKEKVYVYMYSCDKESAYEKQIQDLQEKLEQTENLNKKLEESLEQEKRRNNELEEKYQQERSESNINMKKQ